MTDEYSRPDGVVEVENLSEAMRRPTTSTVERMVAIQGRLHRAVAALNELAREAADLGITTEVVHRIPKHMEFHGYVPIALHTRSDFGEK